MVTSNGGAKPQKLLSAKKFARMMIQGTWEVHRRYLLSSSEHFRWFEIPLKGFLDVWKRFSEQTARVLPECSRSKTFSFFFSSVSKELHTKWYYWESLLFLIAVPQDQSSREAPELCSYISFFLWKGERFIALVVILVLGMQKASEKNSSHHHEICKTSI